MNTKLTHAPLIDLDEEPKSPQPPDRSRPPQRPDHTDRSEPAAREGQDTCPPWKRGLDLGVIVGSLPILLPLFALIAAWIKATSRGPVFFRQERVGRNGETFTILKFRTMNGGASTAAHEHHVADLIDSDAPMVKLDTTGDARLIPGASFLRNSGLDELPQLINVVLGEMSVVGPRPCLPVEYELYSTEQRERFDVAPGLTGYWQVKGKNRTTFSEMVSLDVHYVRNRSLPLDLQVIALTPFALGIQLLDALAARDSEPAGDEQPQKSEESPRLISK